MCILRYLWFGSAYLRSIKIRQKEVPQVSITVASKVIVKLIKLLLFSRKGLKVWTEKVDRPSPIIFLICDKAVRKDLAVTSK